MYSYGFVNQHGDIVIKPKYDELSEFNGNIAIGRIGYTYYVLDMMGKHLFETDDMFMFDCTEDKIVFANRDSNDSDGVGNYGYLDTLGNVIIPAKFKKAYNFKEGVAVAEDDNFGYIDSLGNFVIPPVFLCKFIL